MFEYQTKKPESVKKGAAKQSKINSETNNYIQITAKN